MQEKRVKSSTDEIFTLSQLAAQIAKDAGVKDVVSIHPIHEGAVLDIDYTPALLHREFNDNEIFVSHICADSVLRDEEEKVYEISGICDFENSLIGHYELDWVEVNNAMGSNPNLFVPHRRLVHSLGLRLAHFFWGYKNTYFLSPCSVERRTLYSLHELMECLPKENKNTVSKFQICF